jgi:hypothetical protein
MSKQPLGSLKRVDLREYWGKEATEFTPWLAANVRLLGDSIGLDLEVESQEHDVGDFRADLLCKDTTDDHWVIVENQLDPTDHRHLGQLLTYAAALGETVTVVWIAERFRDEHRAVLDWLNRVTDEGINFFGIEIELWKIGDSSPAPKFNIVCKPNEWSRTLRESASGELSNTRQSYLEYWESYREYLETHSKLRCQKPGPRGYIAHTIGKTGVHLSAVAHKWNSETGSYDGEIRAELVASHGISKALTEFLAPMEQQINKEFGEALIWHRLEGGRIRRLYVQRTADVSNKNDWAQQHAWLVEKIEKLDKVFRPKVREFAEFEEGEDLPA